MTTTTVAVPTAEELAELCEPMADEDLVHMVRPCDPDIALCGELCPGDDFAEDDEDGPRCPECVAIDRASDREHVAVCAVCREAGSS